jgi:hypothetical protein
VNTLSAAAKSHADRFKVRFGCAPQRSWADPPISINETTAICYAVKSKNNKRENAHMRRLQLISSALLFAWCLSAGAQSNDGVTVIDNPGGGTVAYAQMPAQHSLPGAMGKVLQYVHARFGARPEITHVMRGSDGNSLAIIFTVKSSKADG